MKSHCLRATLAFLFAIPTMLSLAEDTGGRQRVWASAAPQPGVVMETDYVAVMEQATGEPILVINYPWARHERPSVEVRRLEDKPESAGACPLFFLTRYMKGTNLVAIFRCEQLAEEVPARAGFTEDETVFEVVGQRNALGKPSALVRCRCERAGPHYGVRAVFCLLDAWAIDGKTLYLELPREDFGSGGRIEVIFYRGTDLLWTETAPWPGFVKAKTR